MRFVIGLAVGAASMSVPLYISEVAPPRVRGALVSFNQLALTTGILVSFLVDYALSSSADWRLMFGLATIPAVLLFVGMWTQAESPVWLVTHDHIVDARRVLTRVRSADHDIEGEIDDIRALSGRATSYRELLRPDVRKLVTIGMAIALFVVAGTFAVSGNTLDHTAAIVAVASLAVYTGSFAVGLGPVFWLLISEIYPEQIRGKSMSTATIANWAANFAVALSFLTLLNAITNAGTFLLMGFVTLVAVAYFWKKVPETQGLSPARDRTTDGLALSRIRTAGLALEGRRASHTLSDLIAASWRAVTTPRI